MSHYLNSPEFEGKIIAAPLTFMSEQHLISVETESLDVYRIKNGPQRWVLEFELDVDTDNRHVWSSLSYDQTAIKTMVMPQQYHAEIDAKSGLVAEKPLHVLSAAGVSSVWLMDDTIGNIPLHRFIKFSNHDKVYRVENAVTFSDSKLAVKVDIFPNLIAPITAGTKIYTDDRCTLRYQQHNDMLGTSSLTVTDGIISSLGTIKIQEAL